MAAVAVEPFLSAAIWPARRQSRRLKWIYYYAFACRVVFDKPSFQVHRGRDGTPGGIGPAFPLCWLISFSRSEVFGNL